MPTDKPTDDPLNVLDMQSPYSDNFFPKCLETDDCQLLQMIRTAFLTSDRAERSNEDASDARKWREILQFLLAAQGGSNTDMHTDSHGLATWITMQQGTIIFVWIARPTDEERDQWFAEPRRIVGKVRYLVVRPGETICFPSCTIHAVIRPESEPTVAVGGHYLQWSRILPWLQTVIKQLQYPNATNEDMAETIRPFLDIVETFVRERDESDYLARMVKEEDVTDILNLIKVSLTPVYCSSKQEDRTVRVANRSVCLLGSQGHVTEEKGYKEEAPLSGRDICLRRVDIEINDEEMVSGFLHRAFHFHHNEPGPMNRFYITAE
jgi:hypothetical protein